MRKSILLLCLIVPLLVSAQKRNRYKYEWIGSIGSSHFLGDLGGADQIGTHLAADWDWRTTYPVISAGLRYKNSRFFGFKGALALGFLGGADSETKEYYRNARNIAVRTQLVELSVQAEFYFNKEQQGHLYRIKNAKGARRIDLQGYGFVGLGFVYYNAQGSYKGSWYSLRPLSTEGQGLPGGPSTYLPITMSFPFGVGAKYGIDKKWSVGLEIGLHYTLSDYLDDVSGVYYDNNVIRASKGDAAAYFADPSTVADRAQFTAGEMRGEKKWNDAYVFAMLNVNYKVMYRKRPKSKF